MLVEDFFDVSCEFFMESDHFHYKETYYSWSKTYGILHFIISTTVTTKCLNLLLILAHAYLIMSEFELHIFSHHKHDSVFKHDPGFEKKSIFHHEIKWTYLIN